MFLEYLTSKKRLNWEQNSILDSLIDLMEDLHLGGDIGVLKQELKLQHRQEILGFNSKSQNNKYK